MIYMIALILIFIESTFSIKILSMIVTFPFLTMLSSKDYKLGVAFLFLSSQIHSLQSESYLRYFLIFTLIYLISHLVLTQLSYSRENVLIFVAIQLGILALFFRKYLELWEYIFNGVGMIILNYIFIKTSWRKNR